MPTRRAHAFPLTFCLPGQDSAWIGSAWRTRFWTDESSRLIFGQVGQLFGHRFGIQDQHIVLSHRYSDVAALGEAAK